jgi:hypothetical protein
VLDGHLQREPREVSTFAAARFLSLFGLEAPTPPHAPKSVPLGDAIAVCRRSLGLDIRVPTLVSALVVEQDGPSQNVGDVLEDGDLEDLIAWARDHTDGIVIVADAGVSPHESMAERLRDRLGASQAAIIRGVSTLADAMEVLFHLGPSARAGTLVPPLRRSAARASLFEAALQARIAYPWQLVRDLAIGLARHAAAETETDTEDTANARERARFELELVRDIASRHLGLAAPIPWPEEDLLTTYDRSRRLSIVAHVVQSAADGRLDLVPEYASRARQLISDEEATREPEALVVLGALGRALAATGQYEDARRVLSDAVRGWLATSPSDGSYALCELLRLEGIRGAKDEIYRLRDRELRLVLAAQTDASSKPYLTLALGRALAQCGCEAEALPVLESAELGVYAPYHVRTAAQRWRAVAARAVGAEHALRDALDTLDALGPSDQRELARLDGEDLDVETTVQCLETLVRLPSAGGEAARLLDRLAPGLSLRAVAERPDILRRLRAEYRY